MISDGYPASSFHFQIEIGILFPWRCQQLNMRRYTGLMHGCQPCIICKLFDADPGKFRVAFIA
jgi:hypothetical protein